jgi:hypothetical protein
MVQQMAAGSRLVPRGRPEQCHGVVRFGWAAVGPDDTVLAAGTNGAGTDLDGRFRWLTGFWDPAGPNDPEASNRADRPFAPIAFLASTGANQLRRNRPNQARFCTPAWNAAISADTVEPGRSGSSEARTTPGRADRLK